MNTILYWLLQIGAVLVILVIIGIPIWIYESRDKKKKFDTAFDGREPIDEQTFYERYFQSLGIPFYVVVKVKKILEEVLEADLSRLRAEDDFTKNLSFFFCYDSFSDIEIIERLEEEFNIKISAQDASSTHTVRDIINLVWFKVSEMDKSN